MATLNLVLDTRRAKKDGTYPLVFRLRAENKFCDIASGFTLLKKNFDLKTSTVVKDVETNNLLDKLKEYYNKRLKDYLTSNPNREDLKEAKLYLLNKQSHETTIEKFWCDHIESMRIANRNGGARVYEMSLSIISKEINLDVPFHKIAFKNIVALETKLYQRGMSTNGIGVYMRSFRAICNLAINLELAGNDWYPFRKYKIKKEKTTPRVLTLQEIRDYFSLDLDPNNPLYQSWCIGKLIFMLRGINLKDLVLLSSENIKGDRVVYKRAKTGKIYSVQMVEEVKQLLGNNFGKTLLGVLTDNDLKDLKRFVELYMQRRKVVNAHLKKLGKLINSKEPISTYVFRYTYANIAKQMGYSKDLIAEALGHEYGNSVTGIYLEQFDLELVDEMNSRLIEAVGNKEAPL